MSNSVDNGPQEASDRGNAVRTSMLLVGFLVAGVSLLHLPTSLLSLANTQVEASPPIVKASDKWIGLGVDASSSQVPTALLRRRLEWQSQRLTFDGAGRQALDHVLLQQYDQDHRWQ